MSTYTVKKGDTLSSIAKQYGTTYQDIAKANGISDPNKIYAGQTLTIGGNDTQAQKTTTSTAANKTPTATTATTTPTTKEFSYDDFKVSEGTAAADKKRQELASQKPGEFTYDEYVKSDIVKQAEAMLEQQLANKPGEYSSQWQAALDETMNKILNREKFSYDLNGDALYQQYKDQYMLQGQQAMMDTMGQAAAMTGGYGNSYAQSVGQQTYQGYLQGLNDKIPELYQLALDHYNQQGNDLMNQYSLLADRENTDYGRYRDQVGDYKDQLNVLLNQYNNERSFDYGQYRDSTADAQWQAEFDEAKRQYDQQYAASQARSSGGGGGGGGGDTTSDNTPEAETDWAAEAINMLRSQFPGGIVTDAQTWNRAAEMAGGADVLRKAGLSVNLTSKSGVNKVGNLQHMIN